MTKRRVLLLATYPTASPRHGGQRRARAIADCYRQSGWEVKQIGAYPRGWYRYPRGWFRYPRGWFRYPRGWFRSRRATGQHIQFPKRFTRYLSRHGLRADLHACRYFEQHEGVQRRLIRWIEKFRPHAIQFEQPWLFPVLADYLRAARQKYCVVYSSQNIECELLREVLAKEGHPQAEAFVREARGLEQALVDSADVTICVTQQEATVFKSWGAAAVLVAANGAARRPHRTCSPWENRTQGGAYAFVIGSAHPPNCSGFLDVLGAEFAFVPPEAKVMIAGGMVHLLDASRTFQVRRQMVERRTIRVAEPAEQDLDYLLNHASVILLPITQGGGSNIKTAEALLSNRPIIATSIAMRGFEAFRNAPGVVVEDDPSRFRLRVQQALRTGARRRTARRDADELLWENSVREIPTEVARLVAA